MQAIRGHVYPLKPTPQQEILLGQTAGVVRLVYNLALEQRRDFGRRTYTGKRRALLVPARTAKARDRAVDGMIRKTAPTSVQGLSDELSDLRRQIDWIGAVSQTAQNQALIDLDRAFANFFEGRAGFPRPRRRGRDDSFRHVGREITLRRLNGKWSEVKVPKIGWVRLRLTRPLAPDASGKIQIRNATFRRRSGGGWEIAIAHMCEIAERPLPNEAVGIDRGVAVPYALSTGEMVSLPATMARRERAIRRAQKDMARRKRGSRRHARARARAARLMARNARVRAHFAHVLTRSLSRRFGMIAIEDLKIGNMTASASGTVEAPGRNVAQKAGLNRAILNVGWHALERLLGYKLEETGGILVKVPAAYSSQTCSCCGHMDAKSRESQATFACTACGSTHNADTNAAKIILQRALAGGKNPAWRGNTPPLDVEDKAMAPCEASTPSRSEGLNAPS